MSSGTNGYSLRDGRAAVRATERRAQVGLERVRSDGGDPPPVTRGAGVDERIETARAYKRLQETVAVARLREIRNFINTVRAGLQGEVGAHAATVAAMEREYHREVVEARGPLDGDEPERGHGVPTRPATWSLWRERDEGAAAGEMNPDTGAMANRLGFCLCGLSVRLAGIGRVRREGTTTVYFCSHCGDVLDRLRSDERLSRTVR